MANYLEYILSLKDQMSSTLQRAGLSAAGAKIKIGTLENQVDSLDRSFKKASGGGISTFKIALGNFIASAAMRLGQAVPQLIGNIFDSTAKREQDIIGLTTFLGDNAKQVYNNIKRDAEITPFSTQSLIDVNRALISSGLSADQARKDALNLANAIAAVGKGDAELSNMAANMQQIKTLGKATSMDIRQFAFAGINIYDILGKATGKSVKEVQDMEVTYEQLSSALEKAAGSGGVYAGALDKQGKSLGAMWNTAKEVIGNALTDFGDKMRPFFNQALQWMQKFGEKLPAILDFMQPAFTVLGKLFFGLLTVIAKVAGWFNTLFEDIKKGNPALIGLVIIIGSIVGSYMLMATWQTIVTTLTTLWTGAQWLLNAALTANPIGVIIALIIALGALIGYIIYKYEGWGEAWKNLVTYLEASWQEFKAGFYLVWLQVEDFFLSGVDKLKAAWYGFQSLWDEESANAGLSKLGQDAASRAQEIANQRGIIAQYQNQQQAALSKIALKDSGKGVGTFITETKSKLGISEAKLPGTVKTSFGGDGKGKGKGGSRGGGKSSESVATGGQKNVTVNVTYGNAIGSFNLTTATLKESVDSIKDLIIDTVTRGVAMGASLGAS